jgi:hypothetical protein
MASVKRAELEIDLIGQEAQVALLKPIFFDDSLELFQKMLMVNSKQKIAYASVLKNVIQRSISCGMRPKGEVDIYERTINTEYLGIYLNQCYDEALNICYESLLKSGNEISDLTGTFFMEVLVTRAQEAIKKDLEKLAFYGDKTSSNEDNNTVDGMWVYIKDLVSKNAIPYVNTGSGSPLAAGDGIDILQEMYEEQRNELKAVAPDQKIFLVTTDLYFQYQKDLREGSINSSAFTGNVQQGGLGTAFESIEVRPMWDWQQYALEYQGVNDAHEAILTTRDNMIMATDIQDEDVSLEVWYDKDSELNKVRSKFRFGFNYKLEEFLVAAF